MAATAVATADFSGYATKAGLKCSDGLTIMPNAFEHQDGMSVPLVWQHGHGSPENVLGHAVLENRPDGVYAQCYFNASPAAQSAKAAVEHKDINSLSIYANKLVKKLDSVVHGVIREVSLVLAGANPGARIDNIAVVHSDGEQELLLDEAIIYTGLELAHSDVEGEEEEPKKTEEVEKSEEPEKSEETEEAEKTEKTEETDESVTHADDEDESIADVYESFTPKQKNVVDYLVTQALESGEEESSSAEQSDNDSDDEKIVHQEGNEMTHNVFEKDMGSTKEVHVLKHSDVEEIFASAKRLGTVKEAVKDYALKHGIEDIDTMFPDAKAVSTTPELLARRSEWVADVMTNVRNTPFSRIKSLYADLTLEDARAKGYVKGSLKREEFFKVIKRITTPQTVYKKQKLDRDDILDITDFDVVAWLKAELRLMLEEEVARAILFGDGRSLGDEDKILEDHIRSIANDHEIYATTVFVNLTDANSSPEEIVDALILQRHHYRGSGNPTFYTKETLLSRMLNVKDDLGRRIYANIDDLASTIRVRKIVPVEAMETETDLVGIMVNLNDYNVGADRGGQTTMFDDFDIDYNQYKYLMETRFSGALVKPKSAIVVRATAAADVLVEPTTPTQSGNTVTVGTQTGVVWTATGATGAVTITAGAFTLTADNSPVQVTAEPAAGYYFPSDAYDFIYEYDA